MTSRGDIIKHEAALIHAALVDKPGLIANELEVVMGKNVTSTLARMANYRLVTRVKTGSPKSDVAFKQHVYQYYVAKKEFEWPSAEQRRAFDRAHNEVVTLRKRSKPEPPPASDAPVVEPKPDGPPPAVTAETFKAQLPLRPADPDRVAPAKQATLLDQVLALPLPEFIAFRNELNKHVQQLVGA